MSATTDAGSPVTTLAAGEVGRITARRWRSRTTNSWRETRRGRRSRSRGIFEFLSRRPVGCL